MAPDLRRWLMGVTLGCAAIAVEYLPVPVYDPPVPVVALPSEQSWEERVRTALSNARREARMAERAERLAALTPRDRAPQPGLRVVLHGAFPPDLARTWRDRVDSIWRTAVTSPRVPVVLVIDGTTDWRSIFSPPSSAASRPACTILMSPGSVRLHALYGTNRIVWTLGPCAYYAAFGMPGRAIEAWLKQRRYDIASSLAWSQPPEDALDGLPRPSLWDRFMTNAMYWSITNATPEQAACARGRYQLCAGGVLQSPFASRLPDDIYPVGFPNEYLASVVRELGPERFGKFWRSEAPVDQAFADAFGVGLGQWTSEWRRTYMPLIPGNTAPRPMLWVYGLLTILLAVGAAATMAGRRQVA